MTSAEIAKKFPDHVSSVIFSSVKKTNLFCRIIGLVRACDGNEQKITTTTQSIVLTGSYTLCPGKMPDHMLENLYESIESEKKRLAPDCRTCASPCGRRNDYTIKDLASQSESLIDCRLKLSDKIITISAAAIETDADILQSVDTLFRLYFAFGMNDWDEEMLNSVLEAAE